MPSIASIYTAPQGLVDRALVTAFMEEQAASGAFQESVSLELKRERRHDNVVKAIAALANTDGGIVLLGVDEDTLDFAASPGVPRDTEQVALADQCRQSLSPTVIPEIIEVPIRDEASSPVILVIRVDVDTEKVPVLLKGSVFVRAPGQSVPATRDQILALARAGEAAGGAEYAGGQALAMLRPTMPDATVGEKLHDCIVRIACGVSLRPRTAAGFVLGTSERGALVASFTEGAAGRLHCLPDPRLGAHESPWEPGSRSAREFSISGAWDDWGGGQNSAGHTTTLVVRREGSRLTFIVDHLLRGRKVVAASPSLKTDSEPHLGGAELAKILMTGVEAVAIDLPDAVVSALSDGPQRLEQVHAWVSTVPRDIGTLMAADLGHGTRLPALQLTQYSFVTTIVPTKMDEVESQVGRWLADLYLDLGCDDEISRAREAIEQAKSPMDAAVRRALL